MKLRENVFLIEFTIFLFLFEFQVDGEAVKGKRLVASFQAEARATAAAENLCRFTGIPPTQETFNTTVSRFFLLKLNEKVETFSSSTNFDDLAIFCQCLFDIES